MKMINPPQRLLFGPGPSIVSKSTLEAMSKPTLGHLDPEFLLIMDQIKLMLKDLFKTKNKLTFPVSAPGSAGMETCFVNLIEPGEKVLVCINGVFGKRMLENVERIKAHPIIIEQEWGSPIDPQKVEDTLKRNPEIKVVAFVHAETSTGVRSDAEEIAKISRKYNALTIVDAVTSFVGIDLDVDGWGLDAVYTGSQKCLSCVPGISPVTFSEKALEKIKKRKEKVPSWFLDLNLVMNYWQEGSTRSYHHTAPVNSMYALHESLRSVINEGHENVIARHREAHNILKKFIIDLGLEFLVEEDYRLPQLNSIIIPKHVDDGRFRNSLLEDFNIEIGAGLGPLAGKVWRIGLMGESAKSKYIQKLTEAFSQLLR